MYTLTTSSTILHSDLASAELKKLIKDEATADNIMLANEDWEPLITSPKNAEDNRLSVKVIAPKLLPPTPEWKDITPKDEKPRPRMYRDQSVVGRKLFDRFKKIVGAANIAKFEKLEVCVAVRFEKKPPKFYLLF